MDYPYKVSFCFGSRKRVRLLHKSLTSLFDLADLSNLNFEVIIKVDFDDPVTIDYIKNHWTNQHENIKFIISARKKGYLSLKDFTEEMADIARGEFICNWNDDVIVKTQNWNNIFENKLKDFKIYYPNVNTHRESFFAIPKQLKHILGYIGPINSLDLYMHQLAELCSISSYIDEVEYYHEYKSGDETWEDRKLTFHQEEIERQKLGFSRFGNSETYSDLVKSDANKILNYLNNLS